MALSTEFVKQKITEKLEAVHVVRRIYNHTRQSRARLVESCATYRRWWTRRAGTTADRSWRW